MTFYIATVQGLLNSAFPWSNRFFLSSSNTEAAVETAFDTAFRGIFTNATFKPFIPTTVAITQTSVSTASATFRQTTKTSTVATTAGTSTSVALPFSTCEIITWRTAQATHWGRGRSYFPPLATNALAATGFELIAAAQTAMQGAFNAYFTAVGSSYTHVLMHRNGVAGGVRAPFSTDNVVTADIPITFAVQRRRADKIVPSRVAVTV